MTATEKRLAVVQVYEEILGRNSYSQSLRDYCYRKYKDGKYYSDCSSSISYAYKEAGFSFGILNTVGMYNSTKLRDVPVVIKNGVIQNKEVLRPGDMLLFARTDSSRASANYVGHVEMIAKVNGDKVTIYGHGSATPRATDMDTYCKNQFAKKTSTKIGNKGLLKVRRFIWDGDDGIYIARGMEGAEVKKLQQNLMKLDFDLPKYGADGDFGSETETALKAFQKMVSLPATGIYDAATDKVMKVVLAEQEQVSPNVPENPVPVPEPETPVTGDAVRITGGTVNVRSGPGKQYQVLDVAKNGETYPAVNMDGWKGVDMGSMVGWVSDKYSEEVKGG